jgi:hypothetical protein
MSDITDKIRSRGYEEVEIRPLRFKEDRIAYPELATILESSRVQLAGWDFPHIGRDKEIKRGGDWYGGESQWEHRIEACRLYQSGLLVDLRGFSWDWRDESDWWPKSEGWRPDNVISVGDVVYRFLEVHLLAANLASTSAGDEVMSVKMTLANLKGRELIFDPRRAVFFETHRTDMETYALSHDYPRADLTANARALALREAGLFFERFGWSTTVERLSELVGS